MPRRKEGLIFTLGRLWDPAKNLAALASVADRLPWPVRAGGSVVHPDGRARAVPGIEALGVLSPHEAAQWLARAAIYAHPALYEPFGLAVAEAALAGCALVLGDIPSLREIWGEERAIYIDPRDPGELEHALRFLIRRPGIRAELGQRARARALAHARLHGAGAPRSLRRGARRQRARGPALPERDMRVALFCHSLLSDWNHGSAHFLRGVVTELAARGTRCAPSSRSRRGAPSASWPRRVRRPLAEARRIYPAVAPTRYELGSLDLDQALAGVDLVIVHEWNDPDLVRRIGAHRERTGAYRALFHDTHHRAVTNPASLARCELGRYDGVLAFGRSLRDAYVKRGLAERVFVWHEAADTRVFTPRIAGVERDLVFIGNHGDGERSAEIDELLIKPVRALGLTARVHGVRYPDEARVALARAGIELAGWLPNHRAPDAYARARATLHIPRRPYVEALPGIPTIRVFEALACGVPLLVARFCDDEGSSRPASISSAWRAGAT